MSHDTFICLLRDHGGCTLVLGVDIVIKVADNSRPLLLSLLVKIGYGDTGGQNGIVRMGNRHVRSGFSSLFFFDTKVRVKQYN